MANPMVYAENVKHAACVVVHNDQGQLLMVSRKSKLDDWNLPGGKVDPGELPVEAAAREVFEETGIKVNEDKLRIVLIDIIEEFAVTCYLAEEWLGEVVQRPNEGLVRWGSWEDILTEKSVFNKYNQELYQTLKEEGFLP